MISNQANQTIESISKNEYENILSRESKSKPISYGKSRVSGSNQNAYMMHAKSSGMPGQRNIFMTSSRTKPSQSLPILNNQITNAFKLERSLFLRQPIGKKYYYSNLNSFTFEEYSPYDDDQLKTAIKACYKQIYGNLYAMESERSIDSERRLRNGDITIRGFIRDLAKSPFYRFHYFEKVNQKKSIEFIFFHILGRPIEDQNELIKNIEIISDEGLEYLIDSLIDSLEYAQFFGEDIIPYQRCWDSPCGFSSSSFVKTAQLYKGFASSHNLI